MKPVYIPLRYEGQPKIIEVIWFIPYHERVVFYEKYVYKFMKVSSSYWMITIKDTNLFKNLFKIVFGIGKVLVRKELDIEKQTYQLFVDFIMSLTDLLFHSSLVMK